MNWKHVQGGPELIRALHELPKHVQGRLVRGAVYAGAVVIRDQARSNARTMLKQGPHRTGVLERNIVAARRRRGNPRFTTGYYVEVRRGVGRYANTRANRRQNRAGRMYRTQGGAYYGNMVELGTKRMRQAYPFQRPAFEAKKTLAADTVMHRLHQGILDIARRQYRG